MNKYFENFPKINYPYLGKMVDSNYSTTVEVVDMTVRFRLIERLKQSPSSYYNYVWKEGERPDQIAYNYYGDENLSWLVMLSADIFDWGYDVPMESSVFYEYLKHKYGTDDVNQLSQMIHHYEDGRGYILDSASYATSGDSRKRIVSVYDFENEANEARRVVKLISKQYTKLIMEELKGQLTQIKNDRRILGIV